ncbi:ATP-binding protein [Streptomyces sp. MNP-20]|uniref:ATP-binding protein n=1 Tax=Streptomyces sp. MNP-20 TaxID=2721165 RepID=UPI0028163944|nr:ATP-binding protein [Streptomyces sp. MNP-20]
MTSTRFADPQPAISERLRARLEAKLAERGLDMDRPLLDILEPVPALEAAQARIPVDYRAALPEHPDVASWVRAIVGNAAAPYADGVNPHYGAMGRRQITHGPSLLLWGPTGTGKTHQAYGAIRALTAAGCGVHWYAATAADLYADLRPRAGVDPEHVLRRIMRIPLLLLDDLGAAKPSEWTEEINFRLVNWRCQHRLPTIVTSNMPPLRTDEAATRQAVLRERVGDRVLSRLSGMCTAVEFTGADRRFQRS